MAFGNLRLDIVYIDVYSKCDKLSRTVRNYVLWQGLTIWPRLCVIQIVFGNPKLHLFNISAHAKCNKNFPYGRRIIASFINWPQTSALSWSMKSGTWQSHIPTFIYKPWSHYPIWFKSNDQLIWPLTSTGNKSGFCRAKVVFLAYVTLPR